jgi:hypothetical protein
MHVSCSSADQGLGVHDSPYLSPVKGCRQVSHRVESLSRVPSLDYRQMAITRIKSVGDLLHKPSQYAKPTSSQI